MILALCLVLAVAVVVLAVAFVGRPTQAVPVRGPIAPKELLGFRLVLSHMGKLSTVEVVAVDAQGALRVSLTGDSAARLVPPKHPLAGGESPPSAAF